MLFYVFGHSILCFLTIYCLHTATVSKTYIFLQIMCTLVYFCPAWNITVSRKLYQRYACDTAYRIYAYCMHYAADFRLSISKLAFLLPMTHWNTPCFRLQYISQPGSRLYCWMSLMLARCIYAYLLYICVVQSTICTAYHAFPAITCYLCTFCCTFCILLHVAFAYLAS